MIECIRQNQYKVSEWSGGTTAQIYISPADGDYAKRKFRFRISSATVRDPESDFTYLEDVDRFLTILSGKMTLSLGERVVEMKKDEILAFSGEEPVHCVGQATDYNLMLKGATGVMKTISTKEDYMVRQNTEVFFFARSSAEVELENGECVLLQEGDTCHVDGEEGCVRIRSQEESMLVIEVEHETDRI